MELVHRMAAGDTGAFQRLFHQYWEKIFSIAYTFTKSEPLSEELVQDTFLKIWMHREKWLPQAAPEGSSNFEGYLFITARNHIYNTLRVKSREVEYQQELHAHFADSTHTDDRLILRQSQQMLQQAIAQLPEQQRKVFLLSRYNGLSHEEIAGQLGVSALTVRAHIRKALATLRVFLQNNSGDLSLVPVLYILLSK